MAGGSSGWGFQSERGGALAEVFGGVPATG